MRATKQNINNCVDELNKWVKSYFKTRKEKLLNPFSENIGFKHLKTEIHCYSSWLTEHTKYNLLDWENSSEPEPDKETTKKKMQETFFIIDRKNKRISSAMLGYYIIEHIFSILRKYNINSISFGDYRFEYNEIINKYQNEYIGIV